jgi:hypothetical protein
MRGALLMKRESYFPGLGGLAVAATLATVLTGCPSGGVGDPCIPEDEYKENFSGFKITEENVESRSFQCQTRICLVNHFQGRVSCPNGQAQPQTCDPGAPGCGAGETCTPSVLGGECSGTDQCPATGDYVCDNGRCKVFVCSVAGDASRCYVPGTNTPIASPVCGQCAAASKRDAENAVYCSCRCDVAEGEDPNSDVNKNFNFCACPKGYVCEEIRKNVGLGDVQLSGKYCIKEGTKYTDANQCGTVTGYWDSNICKGQPASG